jgi:hypothetical protein
MVRFPAVLLAGLILSSVFSLPITITATVDSHLMDLINKISAMVAGSRTPDEIASQIANNKSTIQDVVTKFAAQVLNTSSEDQAFTTMNVLSTGIESNPRGDISLSVVWFAKQEAEGNTEEVNDILSKTSPPPDQAVTRLVTLALRDSTGMTNAKMILDQTADSIKLGTRQPVSGKITDVLHRVSLVDQPSVGGKITDVLQQLILETALIGGRTSAQMSLNGIAEEVASNTGGSLSRIIFSIAQLQENGDANTANNIILAIAAYLSKGGKISEIPSMFGSMNSTKGSPIGDSSPGNFPLPNLGGYVQNPFFNSPAGNDGNIPAKEVGNPAGVDNNDDGGNIPAKKFVNPAGDDNNDDGGNIPAKKFVNPAGDDNNDDGGEKNAKSTDGGNDDGDNSDVPG